MSNFSLCRMCLKDNIKVHSIANTKLQEIYENLIRNKISIENERSLTVCYICHSQLQRVTKLSDLAQNSEKLLLQLYHSGIELSQDTAVMLDRVQPYNYSVTPIESISLIDLEPIEVINDIKIENNVQVKQETKNAEKDMIEVAIDIPVMKMDSDFDNGLSSDSEDNIPLNTFKRDKKIIKKVKIKRQKRGYQKDVKIDATEVILTKEQQLEAVLERSKSLNYLNSPFKCHLCYKGFVNSVTYSNHTEKHDESSGIYKCDICALRYRSARLLRTHSATAHARHYKCNKCDHLSHTTNQARDHEKWHEGFTFECQLCSQQFKKRTSYLTHTRKNHPTESVCNLCGYSFVGKNGLLLHKSKTHKRHIQEEKCSTQSMDRFCSTCIIQFASLEAYQRHLLTSVKHKITENSSTQCSICKDNHPDYVSLMEHLKIHKKRLLHPTPVVNLSSVQTQLPCDVCGATFISRSRLAAHVNRKHLGLKYNKHMICEVCGAQFSSTAALLSHQRRHSGARPFPCACGSRFRTRSALRTHARTHSGERPYACRTCHKRFNQKPALNRHYRVHTGAKPYTCQVCSKSFSQSNSLKIHVQTVHLKMPSHRKRKRKHEADVDKYNQSILKIAPTDLKL